MTDPYIQINGTKIEVFDNDLSAVRSIKQLDEDTTLKSKLISTTFDMTAPSGDIPYTGLNFTPTSIQAIATIGGTFTFCVGYVDSARTGGNVAQYGNNLLTPSTNFITIYTAAADYQSGVLKSFNADGLTITWTKGGTPTGTATIKLLCFR